MWNAFHLHTFTHLVEPVTYGAVIQLQCARCHTVMAVLSLLAGYSSAEVVVPHCTMVAAMPVYCPFLPFVVFFL